MRSAFAALVAAAAVSVAAPAIADAAPKEARGLHDARYCEIIELRGSLPDASAVVWNTIGLNKCPAADWEALDADALAEELGATFVVLNGPRHFLMDSATATTGGVRGFHGMRMRKVATIPIRTAAELTQTPYTDRTIKRRNMWSWKRGRTVFELVAPGGDTYVMQSYAQIKDPTLTIGKLAALGDRLVLPAGWRYRARRLRHRLVLTAKGKATIVQDELQNTYQLATTTRGSGKRVRRRVSIEGETRTVTATTPGTVEDHGTLTGTPFGPGSIVLVGTFQDQVLTGTVRLLFRDGSIIAAVSLPYTISGNDIDFDGTAHFIGGTGAYRGISGEDLHVLDHNQLDGQSGTLSVTGRSTF